MLDGTDRESLKSLRDAVRQAEELALDKGTDHDQDDLNREICSGGKEKENTKVVVKSVNLEISLEKIDDALEILADKTQEPDFSDAMEVVWFFFDPKRDHETFEEMSMLTTLMRATLDGNVKPPVDLGELYQRCRQKLGLGQGQGADMNLFPSPGKKRY